MKCPKCGTDVSAGAKFCAHCGSAMAISAICPSCGHESGPDQKFCAHCGKPLAALLPQPPPAGQAMPPPPPPSQPAANALPPMAHSPVPPPQAPFSPVATPAGASPGASPAAAVTPAPKERSGCCVCGLIAAGIIAILVGLAGLAYWQGWLDKIIESIEPKSGIPMAELKAQGRSPIEVSKCQFNALSSGVGVTNFTIAFRNISDCKVKAISAVMVLYNANGNLLPNWRQDTGYAEVAGIPPGGEVEGLQACLQKEAVKAKVIIREVIYLDNPLKGKKGSEFYEVAFKWTNPNFAKEIEAATGLKVKE